MSQHEKKFKVGLIRVLTCEDPEVLYSHQRQIMEKFPTLDVETKCIPRPAGGDPQPRLARSRFRRSWKRRNPFRMWI